MKIKQLFSKNVEFELNGLKDLSKYNFEQMNDLLKNWNKKIEVFDPSTMTSKKKQDSKFLIEKVKD